MPYLRNFPEDFHGEHNNESTTGSDSSWVITRLPYVMGAPCEMSLTKIRMAGGLASGLCSGSGLRDQYRNIPLNSVGGDIKDLTMPDVGTLVDDTQGGVNQRIRLTMHPTLPGLADAMRILNVSKRPISAKFGGGEARRMGATPENGHCMVATVGPNGLFCANTVGDLGSVSAAKNWDRLASAVRRWALKMVENNECFSLLLSGETLVLEVSGIFYESWLLVVLFLMMIRYPSSEKKFWV